MPTFKKNTTPDDFNEVLICGRFKLPDNADEALRNLQKNLFGDLPDSEKPELPMTREEAIDVSVLRSSRLD